MTAAILAIREITMHPSCHVRSVTTAQHRPIPGMHVPQQCCARPGTSRSLPPVRSGQGSTTARKRKPEWVRLLEEDAEVDEDVASVLEGADGDPDLIRENMRLKLENKDFYVTREGTEDLPTVAFREVNPFKLWVWLEFYQGPSAREQELLESVLKAWFMLGKLGGFNSSNMQVFHNADDDRSFFEYDNSDLEDSMGSFIHDVGEAEYRGMWARVRIDMGTCDELALDVLVNMLLGFSRDFCGLKKVYVGGANRSWPVPEEDDEEEGEEGKFNIDPMRLPQGLDEELDLLDDLAPELQDRAREQERQRDLLAGTRGGRAAAARPAPGTLAAAALDRRSEGRQRETAAARSGSVKTAGKGGPAWGAALARGKPPPPPAPVVAPPYRGAGPMPRPVSPSPSAAKASAPAKPASSASPLSPASTPEFTLSSKQPGIRSATVKTGEDAMARATMARATKAAPVPKPASSPPSTVSAPRRVAAAARRSKPAAPAQPLPDEDDGVFMYSQEEFERQFPNRGEDS